MKKKKIPSSNRKIALILSVGFLLAIVFVGTTSAQVLSKQDEQEITDLIKDKYDSGTGACGAVGMTSFPFYTRASNFTVIPLSSTEAKVYFTHTTYWTSTPPTIIQPRAYNPVTGYTLGTECRVVLREDVKHFEGLYKKIKGEWEEEKLTEISGDKIPTPTPSQPESSTKEGKSENPFENAILITTGKTYKGELTESKPIDEYKIKVKAGKELVIKLTTPCKHGRVKIHLYNEYRERLLWEYTTLHWLSSFDTTYYIEIESRSVDSCSYSLTASFIDRHDANSGTDAGSTMNTAIKISSGKYKGFLALEKGNDYEGDDLDDMYVLHLGEGQTVNVRVIPERDKGLALSLFDQDLNKLHTDCSSNEGAIARISWDSPSSQDIYILVTSEGSYDKFGSYVHRTYKTGGSYTLEVDVTPPTPTPTLTSPKPTPTVTPTQKTPPTPTSAKTPEEEKRDVLGFEAIFAIAGLLAVAYLLRRRG